jgi:hypothetical protein
VTVTAYITPTTSPDAVPSPVAAPPPAQLRTSFSDGTYEVGVDIAPGRYKTPGHGICYWERAKSDSGEPRSILANDVDGPAIVTVKAGEFFKVQAVRYVDKGRLNPGPVADDLGTYCAPGVTKEAGN